MNEIMIADIPRALTGFAEWGGCLVYVFLSDRRFSPKITALYMTLALVMQMGLQRLAGLMGLELWVFGMIINVGFMLITIKLMCDMTINETIAKCARAFIIAEFTASFSWQFISNISQHRNVIIAIPVILVMLTTFGIAVLEKLIIKENRLEISKKEMIIEVLLSLMIFSISNMAFVIGDGGRNDEITFYIFWIRTLVDFGGLCMLYLQERYLIEQQMKGEISAVRNVLNLQYQQYLEFKENNDYISRQCHDLKHQIAAIRQAASLEEVESYLEEMEMAIGVYEAQVISENSVLDTIINRKKMYCIQHNILFYCSVDGRDMGFMAVRDICTIFGNAIDNAIECVAKIDNIDNRQVRVEVYKQNSFLMIRFENYCEDRIEFNGNLPVTTKGNKERHGYGVKSIIYTVEKYGGNVNIQLKDNWFKMQILVPIPDSK